MIETYEERRTTVQALQLRPDTFEELCRWTNGQPSVSGVWFADRRGEHVVHQNDWVVQANGGGGGFHIVPPDVFNDRYRAIQP